ncbi:MAG: cell division protein SepF [Selenomonadaceae bacterium]|nr:cell division protein SepF [Selenomonadaceae bacterium]
MGIKDMWTKTFGSSEEDEKEVTASAEKNEIHASEFEPQEDVKPAPTHAPNVVDFSSAVAFRDNARGTMIKSKITTIRPKSFTDDAQTIANCLREKVPVIINFENTDTADAQRIVDFISGTIYALNGTLKQVSQKVFISAPNNVTVTYTEDVRKTDNNSWMNK